MIEDLAIKYMSQSDVTLRLINYGLVILGAVVAGKSSKSTAELLRSPYFAYHGALALAGAASQLIWLESLSAMAGGYLWVLVSTNVISFILIGYFYGVIAMARSRDAYGHAGRAVLAFIPFLNFVLFFVPSKNEMSATPTIPLLSGGVGILMGFIALVAGYGLSGYRAVEMQRIDDALENDPDMLRSTYLKISIRSQGLEEVLKQIASEIPSERIDEITNRLWVEADGMALRYIYSVSVDMEQLPSSVQTGLVQQTCTDELMRPLIEAGATIEHVYYFRGDRSEIGTVPVAREMCGF